MQNLRKGVTTVIIPCYNQEDYLFEAVESVLRQTVPCEIVIVDDGSTIPVENLWDYITTIKLVRQENKGLANARNRAIIESETEYILPLDADDLLHPTFIENTINKGDIVTVMQQEFGDSNTLWNPGDDFSLEAFKTSNRANCCSLYKKEMWEKIGGYDENMREGYEDWDFWLRAVKAGYKFHCVHKPLFFYRKHGHSMVNDAYAKHEKIHKYILDKNFK